MSYNAFSLHVLALPKTFTMPTAAAQSTKSGAITLKGSAEIIAEFFRVGVNSILFQRGVYPFESFSQETAYELPVYVTKNPELTEFILQFTSQLEKWLVQKTIQKVVLVIMNVKTRESIERWQFNIECDKKADENTQITEKPLKAIQKEMKEMVRQVISSVTILPHLEELCSFDILAYTDEDCEVPLTWDDGDDHFISNSEEVKLKSLDTKIHKVDMAVCYKLGN